MICEKYIIHPETPKGAYINEFMALVKIHTAQSPSDFNVEGQLLENNDWNVLDNLFNDSLI
ncbi:MAG: hypothetical protein A2X12_07470 [Bacteroidetes bacterium GWE2_29_8]|nr:MAG: hypothetical protein A2X12_07470 [Bacteroidetes bacterium GWE2_29_8]